MPRFRKGKKALRTLDRINEGLFPLFVDLVVSPKQYNLARRYMTFHNARLDAMIEEVESDGWCCGCGHYEDSDYHCSRCGGEPPWGCDCSTCQDRAMEGMSEPGHPNFDPIYGCIYLPTDPY